MASERKSVVVKRRRAAADEGHHGGAWKVAYADFVTAMMAFFLLLWLLSSVDEQTLQGIAAHFAPIDELAPRGLGGEGLLRGQALGEPGILAASSLPLPVGVIRAEAAPGPHEGADESAADGAPAPATATVEPARPAAAGVPPDGAAGAAGAEADRFDAAEEQLRAAILGSPDLLGLAGHLLIDRVPEGLRVQLVDRSRVSMFPLGSAEMYGHTDRLLRTVAGVVADLPNRVAVTGHTDAAPFGGSDGYGNWELSTDRAHATWRVLVDAGLPEARIEQVTGVADREPLLPDQPLSAMNRRISIVLRRDAEIEPRPREGIDAD